ncbi:hypothetical protein EMGBD3_02980 [Nitrosarchaeum sp.]|nr:hypothetical protein EMGBD3_02980 [Nitrosarchaeum sp.]
MNLKISACVLISFLIAFSIFSYVMFLPTNKIQAETPLPLNEDYYLSVQQDFFSKIDPYEKNVFIIGSSYIMALNTTQIHNYLALNDKDYQIYNLSIFGDGIKKRATTIDMIISAKPEVVVYGITEDDFSDPIPVNTLSAKPTSILPDPHEFFHVGFDMIENHLKLNFPDSPKAVTWVNLRQIMGTGADHEKYSPYPGSPFMKISSANTVTISDLELKNQVAYLGPFGQIKPPQNNPYLKSLKQVLDKLKENNIKVVLFVVPHHNYLLSKAPPEYEETFDFILKDIEEKYELNVYKRNLGYSDLPIWHDLSHVAVNKKSQPFSDDVAKMIQDVVG